MFSSPKPPDIPPQTSQRPPQNLPKCVQNVIVVEMFEILSKTSGLNSLVFLRFWEVLEVLDRSGGLRGRSSPNFRQQRCGESRVTTEKPSQLLKFECTQVSNKCRILDRCLLFSNCLVLAIPLVVFTTDVLYDWF